MENSTNLINIVVDYQQALINFDNADLIEIVKKITNKYSNLIVSEDMTKDISKEIATLNKITKSIEDRRKEIKRDYTTPLSIFETKIKDVTSIINSTVNHLKTQLDIFEQQRKDAKKIDIFAHINGMNTVFNFDDKYLSQIIVKESFYNKTVKEADIIVDLRQQFTNLANVRELETMRLSQEKERIERETKAREDKIKEKYELISVLNSQYNFSFSFADLNNCLSSEDIIMFYKNKADEVGVIDKNVQDLSELKGISNEKINAKVYCLVIENLTEKELLMLKISIPQNMPNAILKEI